MWNFKSSLNPPVAARLLIFRATMIYRLPKFAYLWQCRERALGEGNGGDQVKVLQTLPFFTMGQQLFLYKPSDYWKPLINFQSSENIDFDSFPSIFIAFIKEQIVEVLSLPWCSLYLFYKVYLGWSVLIATHLSGLVYLSFHLFMHWPLLSVCTNSLPMVIFIVPVSVFSDINITSASYFGFAFVWYVLSLHTLIFILSVFKVDSCMCSHKPETLKFGSRSSQ